MTKLAPRVYLIDSDVIGEGVVCAIADTSDSGFSPQRGELAVSFDGETFYPALFNCRESGPGLFNGKLVQPEVGVDGVAIDFADGKMTYDGRDYVLDEKAIVVTLIDKPMMKVNALVETPAGFYVQAQNLFTGKSHHFLAGVPLEIIPGGGRVRGDDSLVEDSRYVGHRYIVCGDPLDRASQTATFDDKFVTQLDAGDYEVVFADDLTFVSVTKK